MIEKITHDKAYKRTVFKEDFRDTRDIEVLNEFLINQEDAIKTLEFGLCIDKYGNNIFLSGPESSRKKLYLEHKLKELVTQSPIPNDLCYIYNFDDKNRPILVEFPAGEGHKFKDDMVKIAEKIKEDLELFFSGKGYKKELENLEQEYRLNLHKLLEEFRPKLVECNHNIIVDQNLEVILYPCDSKGKELSPNKIKKMYAKRSEAQILELNKQVNLLLLEIYSKESNYNKELEESIEEFEESKVSEIVKENIKHIEETYIDTCNNENKTKKLKKYIQGIEEYVIENMSIFKERPIVNEKEKLLMYSIKNYEDDLEDEYFANLNVNLIVDNKDLKSAPIVFAKNISSKHELLGGMTYEMERSSGSMKSDFLKIVAGDLIKANGGILVADIEDIIELDLFYELIKTLEYSQIKFIGKSSYSNMIFHDELKPEPIDIKVKVILTGDDYVYHMLSEAFPKFREIFGIHSNLKLYADRNELNEMKYARLIKTYSEDENLKPLTSEAISRLIEYSARVADSQNKLPLYYSHIYKILAEANTLAILNKQDFIELDNIDEVISNLFNREYSFKELEDERIEDKVLVIDVDGYKVGEINGLAVSDLMEFSIGHPLKITANTYKDKRYVLISNDKEAGLAGRHGVKAFSNILGFLGETFAKGKEFPISINISFEQNYGNIDGDSASLAKTCAILSSLSGVPINQSIAITGSMNQKGKAQAIGGVNAKIEGFFDACKVKGKDKDIGVIIPKSNSKNLMVRSDILESIEKGDFTLYTVESIEDAVEILMGKSYDEIIDIIKIETIKTK